MSELVSLKPCPFCQWPAFVFDSGDDPYWVDCSECGSEGPPEDTREAAIAAWNTRPLEQQIERLTQALDHLESEARRFASFYPEASDGRNTFVIFADKIASVREE